jgi:cysteine-rich secretory family protein
MPLKNLVMVAIVLALACLFPAQSVAASPEKQLLELVNQERAAAQLQPLQWDAGLAHAAQAHALAMAMAHELSHQLRNEASLPTRLTSASSLRMDAEGENVAMDVTVESAHLHLMHSPPHRANILDGHFNYAGFAAVWDKGQLWVVEDFAHAGHDYSTEAAEDLVAKTIDISRAKSRLQPLQHVKLDWLHDVACGMAQADSLQTGTTTNLSHKYNVITYTQTDPAVLPASNLPGRPDIHEVSVAVCSARTKTYPSGVYWVVALFY